MFKCLLCCHRTETSIV